MKTSLNDHRRTQEEIVKLAQEVCLVACDGNGPNLEKLLSLLEAERNSEATHGRCCSGGWISACDSDAWCESVEGRP